MPAATRYLTNTIIADCHRALVVELSRVHFRRPASAPGIVVVVVGSFAALEIAMRLVKVIMFLHRLNCRRVVFNVTLLQFNPIVPLLDYLYLDKYL